jgi:hypothetical protein
MAILGNLIFDFLDKEPYERAAGSYSFETSQTEYIFDISNEYYFYRVRRHPSETISGIVDVDFRDFQVKEVFSITKASSATYVNRDYGGNTTYEGTLLLAVTDPGATVVLYGPSKLGKSALWRNVMELDTEAIMLPCTPKETIEGLYRATLYKLGASYISEIKDTSKDKISEKTDVSIKLGVKSSQISSSYGTGHEHADSKDILKKFSDMPANADIVGEQLSKRRMAIVFENYHRLNKGTLDDLCFDIRTFSDHGVTTILAGIPDDPYEIIKINGELEGRTFFLPFDFWGIEELKQIAIGGSQALNIQFDNNTLCFIAGEASGSPLLMQLYSLIACLASRVTEAHKTLESPPVVSITHSAFEMAMQRYTSQILQPCELVCQALATASSKYASIPNNFAKKLYSYLKNNDPTLKIKYSDLDLPPISKIGIRTLTNFLNRNTITHDLMIMEQGTGNIKISSPRFVAYVRWLLSDNECL